MISIVKHQAVIALLVTILSNFSDCDYCPASAPTVSVVSKCPTNKTEWDQAASRKKCSHMSAKCGDKSPVYHCLLNQWGNETVEVCASTWYISGFCAIYNTDEMKVIDNFERDCTAFSEGKCPPRYISSEAYLYQKCYMQKSSNTIPLPDISIGTEETNDCSLSTVTAIVVTVLVLVITSLVVFITLRLEISKKAPDEKCMPFCNATKQKVREEEEDTPFMTIENEDNTMNQSKETSKLVLSGDTAKSKQMTDIQQKRYPEVHIEEDGVHHTGLGVTGLKARFEAKPPGLYSSERGIDKPNRKFTDDIQRTVHNTNNDVEGTLHGHIINAEGTDEFLIDPAADRANAIQKDYTQKADNSTYNDNECTLHGNSIDEEGSDEEDTKSLDSTPSESVTDTPNEKPTEVEQKMDNTIKNDVGFSSPESLINEENNDEENTESPDSTPSESVTDTPNEKPTDSDSETEKQSKNEGSEKKAVGSHDGKVSQGGVQNIKKIFEEKSRNVLNA